MCNDCLVTLKTAYYNIKCLLIKSHSIKVFSLGFVIVYLYVTARVSYMCNQEAKHYDYCDCNFQWFLIEKEKVCNMISFPILNSEPQNHDHSFTPLNLMLEYVYVLEARFELLLPTYYPYDSSQDSRGTARLKRSS